MKSKNFVTILSVIGVILFVICIITSVIAINSGKELKEISDGFVQSGQLTAAAEVKAKEISNAKSTFLKYLVISLLTFVATILDAAIIYMKILSTTKKEE